MYLILDILIQKKEDIRKCREIEIISESEEAGLYLMQSNNFKKNIYIRTL